MARPSNLTPEVERRILEAIWGGNYQETAAALGGVSERTFHRWMERGRVEDERRADPTARPRSKAAAATEAPFWQFWQAITRARAEVEARNVAQLQKAAGGGMVVERRTVTHDDGRSEVVEKLAPPDWRANGWWLERSFPQRWGRREQLAVEHAGPDGGPIPVEVRTAELLGRARKLRPPATGKPRKPASKKPSASRLTNQPQARSEGSASTEQP